LRFAPRLRSAPAEACLVLPRQKFDGQPLSVGALGVGVLAHPACGLVQHDGDLAALLGRSGGHQRDLLERTHDLAQKGGLAINQDETSLDVLVRLAP